MEPVTQAELGGCLVVVVLGVFFLCSRLWGVRRHLDVLPYWQVAILMMIRLLVQVGKRYPK